MDIRDILMEMLKVKITKIAIEVINDWKGMGWNLSLKIHFQNFHIEFFYENFGAISDEYEEEFLPRYFHYRKTISK